MATPSSAGEVLGRIGALIAEGTAIQRDREDNWMVEAAPYAAWRTRTRAFLGRLLGPTDTYTTSFDENVGDNYHKARDRGIAILANLRGDIENGYLDNIYLGIAGEVISDLLDLGTWSLGEGSKEAGAILAGSALELGLRRLARNRSVDVSRARGIDDINDALASASVYPAVRRGQIDAWRILRNHAIHGDHEAYSSEEARLMLEGVRGFLVDVLR